MNAASLLAAGVPVAFQAGEGNPYGVREPLLSAGYAMKFGVSEEDALRAVTSWPAAILGLDTRVGRLAVGLDADFVVLSGRPFDLRTKVLRVFINGREAARTMTRTSVTALVMAVGLGVAARGPTARVIAQGGQRASGEALNRNRAAAGVRPPDRAVGARREELASRAAAVQTAMA